MNTVHRLLVALYDLAGLLRLPRRCVGIYFGTTDTKETR